MTNNQETSLTNSIHWGHFGVVLGAIVLLLGMSWFKNPKLFSFEKNNQVVASANVPRYYAYEQPAEFTQGFVAGASTDQGPMVMSDDGSNMVAPADMGEVLGASTQDVQLSLDDVKVNAVADSEGAAQKYFVETRGIENGAIENSDFETALSSSNQQLINQQAEKLTQVSFNLQKMFVPQSLVKLNKLKIIQYNAAINILKNFTQADQNPQLVGKYLQEFLKSQQDLDDEMLIVAQKYNLDPTALGSTMAMPQN